MSLPKKIPIALKNKKQWIPTAKNKAPAIGKGKKLFDSANWMHYDEVKIISKYSGFILTESDHIVCIDIDNCLDDNKNIINPTIQKIVKKLNSYTEVSQSGQGLHIFVKGYKSRQECKSVEKKIEIYDKERYIVVTGLPYKKFKSVKLRQQQLNAVEASVFSVTQAQEIMGRIRKSNDGYLFSCLHDEGIGETDDRSSTDQSYFNLLARHIRDPEVIKEIAFQSDLVRDKWDREDYIERTIDSAFEFVTAPIKALTENFFIFDFHKQEILSPDWLVTEYFVKNSLASLIGEAGSGKTFVALDFALCIATGIPWHGFEVQKGGALYICGEGQFGMRSRVAAWEEEHKQSELSNFAISKGPAELLDESCLIELKEEVMKAIKRLETINLIVIDTLNANFGDGNESETRDMTAFIKACRELKILTGACILVVHHTGWSNTDRGRGNSALKAAMDTELLIKQTKELPALTVSKQKDAEPAPIFSFDLKRIELKNNSSLVLSRTTGFDGWIEDSSTLEMIMICLLHGVSAKRRSKSRKWLNEKFGSPNVSKAVNRLRELDESKLNEYKSVGLAQIECEEAKIFIN